MPWEETENEIRHRVRDPEDFQPDSFRTITLKADKPRVFAIIGKLKGETKTTIQALRFPKEDGWTMAKAKRWVEEHFKPIKDRDYSEQSHSGRLERLALAPAGAPVSVNRETRRFVARALSGQPVRRPDPVLGEVELLFDPAGADLTRLNSGVAPLLDGHRAHDGIAAQLGVVRRAWWDGKGLMVECELSRRPQADQVLEDIAAGIVRGVSLGVELLETKLERTNGDGPARRIVTRWMPYELSLVPVPADAGAMVLSFTDVSPGGAKRMNGNAANGAPADLAGVRSQVFAEASKILDLVRRANLPEQFAHDLLQRGVTLEQARTAILDELAARYERTPTRSHVSFLGDETVTRREAMVMALMHRVRGGEPAPIAQPYLHMSLPQLARECLRARGERLVGASDARVVELAMTTSDFPALLGDFAQRSLLDAYKLAEPAIKQICRISTARDFRPKRILRIGEGQALVETPEGAEHQYGSIGEWKSAYSLKTYARIYALTRQAVINDELAAFDQFIRGLALLAADFEARLIVDVLTANSGAGPVLDDGYNLFHSVHGNLASTGGAISVTTLGAARAAMRTQKGIDGVVVIDADPRYLVTPAALETLAQQITTQITPHAANDVNPFAGRLIAIAEPRLDQASTTAWYLFADPARVPVIEFGYLEGAQGPQVESETDFNTDAILYKLRLDAGVGIVDFRGAYRNPGS